MPSYEFTADRSCLNRPESRPIWQGLSVKAVLGQSAGKKELKNAPSSYYSKMLINACLLPFSEPCDIADGGTPRSAMVRRTGKKQSRFYPVTKEPGQYSQDMPRKRKTRHSSNPPVEMHVGWIMDSREHGQTDEGGMGGRNRRESFSESIGSLGSSYGSTPQSLPAFQHPSHSLLKENGFTQLQYSKYHSRCLKGKNLAHRLCADC